MQSTMQVMIDIQSGMLMSTPQAEQCIWSMIILLACSRRCFCDSQEQGYSWNDAYGKFLGTNMVCSFATTLISFLPPKVLRKLFPTWIAGLTVFLVGVNLIGVAGISVNHLTPSPLRVYNVILTI